MRTMTSSRVFRPDIEGLRAVAVLIVLLYHAGVPGFSGGYVGVDVFFVVSGFLITGLLVRELQRSGTVRLLDFYTRRIRRLLPASALVALVTLLLMSVLLPPLLVADARPHAIATVSYWANVHLAVSGVDYQIADAAASPFQHYWSLAVEEQFYALWPVLLLVTWTGARRLGRDPVKVVLALLIVLVVTSLSLSVVVTQWRQPWAFFLLPTRAWELAAGGALAVVLRDAAPLAARSGAAVMALGMGGIALATVRFDEATAFPGWAAALPVAAALLALWGGSSTGALQTALSSGPAQAVGRRSYSLYLWHWPLLVLTDGIPGGDLPMVLRAVVLAVSGLLAVLTFWLVEDPVRRSPALVGHPRRSVALGVAGTALSIAAVVQVTAPPVVPTGAPLAAATTRDTSLDELFAEPVTAVPADLTPTLTDHGEGADPFDDEGCHQSLGRRAVTDNGCEYGNVDANRTMFLMGDSHALHWFPALDRIAMEDEWRLVSYTKDACPAYDLPVFSPRLNRDYVECDEWREDVLDRIQREQPELVVLSNRGPRGHSPQPPMDEWLAALEGVVERLPESSEVAVLGQNPTMPHDVPECLSDHLDDVEACAAPVSAVIDGELQRGEEAAAARAGASYVDTTGLVCRTESCVPIVGNLMVFRDSHHLSNAFAAALAPELEALLPVPGGG